MSRSIVNIDSVAPGKLPEPFAPTGEAAAVYEPKVARIGMMMGASALGCNLIELAPGKRAFPFHNHRTNEEMFIVLEGSGEIRIGDDTFPIKANDMISCPAGGAETAHQIINSGSAKMRYLAISTMQTTDIIEYPDSGKLRILQAPIPNVASYGHVDLWVRRDESADYWNAD